MTQLEIGNRWAEAATASGEFALDRRLPAAGQVYGLLREAIIACRLRPNEALSENRICGMFGVSRSPVRIALTRLAEDGLIYIFPQRGTFVAPIKLQQVREGHFARMALELAILKTASAAWNAQASERVRASIAEQEKMARLGDLRGFHRADETFHRLFAVIAGLEGVWPIALSAKTHLDRVRHLANPVPGHMDRVIAEHCLIVEELNAGRTAEALAALHSHLDSLNETIARLRPLHADYFVES